MVGKNNKQEQLRKNATKNTRFSLKKLSVGVASVAVGASLLVGNVAHAQGNVEGGLEQPKQEQFLLQFVVDGVPQQAEAFTGTQQEFMEFHHQQSGARYSDAEFSRTWEGNKLVVTVTPKEADQSASAPEVEAKETYKFVVKREGQQDQIQELQFNSRQEAQVYAESFQKDQTREGEVLDSTDFGLPSENTFTFVYKAAPKPKKEETKFEYQFVVNGEERAAVGYTASNIQGFMDYLTGYISNEFPDTKESPRYEWTGNSVKVFIETENKVKEERKDYKAVFKLDGKEIFSADYPNSTYEEFQSNVQENLKNQEKQGRVNTKLDVDGGVYTYTFEKGETSSSSREELLKLYKEKVVNDLNEAGFHNKFVLNLIERANTIEGINSILSNLDLSKFDEEAGKKLDAAKAGALEDIAELDYFTAEEKSKLEDLVNEVDSFDEFVTKVDLAIAEAIQENDARHKKAGASVEDQVGDGNSPETGKPNDTDADDIFGSKLDKAKAGALEDIAGLDYFTAEEKSKLEDLVNEVENLDEFAEKVDKAISEAIEENDARHKAAEALKAHKEKSIKDLKAKGFNNEYVFNIIRRAKTIEGVDSVVANLDLSDLDEEAGKKLDAAKAGALEDIAGLDYFTAEEKAKLEDLVNEVENFDEFVEKVDKAISEAIEENDKRHKAAQSSEEKPGKEEEKPGKEEEKPGKEEEKPGKEEQKPGKEEQKPGKEEQKPGKEEQKPGQKESDKGQLQSAKDNAKGEIDKLPNLSDKQKGDLKAGLDKADSLAKVQEILDFARKLNKDQAPKQEDKKEEKKGQRLPDTATGAWALGLVGVSSLLAGAGVKKFKK